MSKFKTYFLEIFGPKERVKILLLFFGSILLAIFEILGVASIVPFMSIVLDSSLIYSNKYLRYFYEFFQYESETTFIIHSGLMVICFIGISNLFSALMFYFMTMFSKFQGHLLSIRILRGYLSQPYSYFLEINSAELGKNILSEVDRIVKGVILAGIQAASKGILVLTVLCFLLVYNPQVALMLILAVGGSYILIYKVARNFLNAIGVRSARAVTDRFKAVNESFTGIKDVKLRGIEGQFIEQFRDPSILHAKLTSQALIISALPRYLIEIIAFGGIIGVVLFLLIVNYPAQEIISTLSLFALGGYRLMPAIQNIYAGISMIKFNSAALDIVINALTLPRKDKSKQLELRAPLPYQCSISLQDISFRYSSNLPNILNKLNLKINHNEAIGLVGKTGSGKTTLVDLLMGLLKPSNGKIFVDSTEINSSNIQNFQSMIGYVPQYIYLIDASISANIAFGVTEENINFDRLEEVSRMANLDKFIKSLPEGLNTMVGENGVRLSGGQRQRIGIARALYTQPQILILDEATSSLDGGTENLVMEAINNLASKVTMVIIAHRLDTLKECNNIYLLDQGEIIASGSYNSLIESNALFQSIAKQDEKNS